MYRQLGTSYFVNKDSAARYYRPYGFTPRDVIRKIADGEISIGIPTLKHGERLVLIDAGTRYAIVSEG